MIPLNVGPVYCEDLSATPGVFPGGTDEYDLERCHYPVRTRGALFRLETRSARMGFVSVEHADGLYRNRQRHVARIPRWPMAFLGSDFRSDISVRVHFLLGASFWSFPGAAVFLGAFYAGFRLSQPYWGMVQRWVAIAPIVVIASLALIAGTWRHSREAAAYGGVALACALIGLTFRSIDLAVCSTIPFGTHFLWHSFLSGAGFIGILGMLKMKGEYVLAQRACRKRGVTSPYFRGIAERARRSARSFSRWPECPCTHRHVTCAGMPLYRARSTDRRSSPASCPGFSSHWLSSVASTG